MPSTRRPNAHFIQKTKTNYPTIHQCKILNQDQNKILLFITISKQQMKKQDYYEAHNNLSKNIASIQFTNYRRKLPISYVKFWIGNFFPKLFWPILRKGCSSDQEKLLKFEADGWDFAKILISLDQFIQTVKG